MAIGATCVWEVQTGGNDANGGGFTSGGTDRSQSTSPHVTIDGVTIMAVVHTTTTQLNIVGFTVSSADVGNVVNVNGGTATAGRYEITAVDTGNNRWTLDRSAGTAAQTATGRMGGCLATPGQLGVIFSTSGQGATGQCAWIKSGTYTLSTASLASGGPFKNTSVMVKVEGYQTTRGDRAARPVLHSGAISGVTLWWHSFGNLTHFICLEANGNSLTGVSGFQMGYSQSEFIKCRAINCAGTSQCGFSTIGTAISCSTDNCYYGFNGTDACYECYCSSSLNNAFNLVPILSNCISKGAGNDGFNIVAGVAPARHCVADGSARYGFNVPTNGSVFECVGVNHTAVGSRGFSMAANSVVDHCAGYNNTTNYAGASSYYLLDSFISLTAAPFQDASAGDYRLNTTAGGGSDLKGTGWGVFGQTDSSNISAVEPAASGGVMIPRGWNGGFNG